MTNPLLAAENRILPALVTPLTSDGRLDERSTERLIDHLYAQGVGGLYVTGTTGEGIHLDFEIRRRLVEIAVSGSRGSGQVIVHVGRDSGIRATHRAGRACGPRRRRRHQQHSAVCRRLWVGRDPRVLHRAGAEEPLAGRGLSLSEPDRPADVAGAARSLLRCPTSPASNSPIRISMSWSGCLTRMSPEQVLYNGQDEALPWACRSARMAASADVQLHAGAGAVDLPLRPRGTAGGGNRPAADGQRHHCGGAQLPDRRRHQADSLLAGADRPSDLRVSRAGLDRTEKGNLRNARGAR